MKVANRPGTSTIKNYDLVIYGSCSKLVCWLVIDNKRHYLLTKSAHLLYIRNVLWYRPQLTRFYCTGSWVGFHNNLMERSI